MDSLIVSRDSSNATTRIVTVDDLDNTIVLSPPSAWGHSNQGNGLTGGSFSLSSTENATAVFRFPQYATSVFWRGFLRPGPALYSVCIDCTDLTQAEVVDGHAFPEQSTDVVTTLFSKAGLPNTGHTITITNLLDPRFGVASQITIDSFILATAISSTSSSVSTSTTNSSQIGQIPITASVGSGTYGASCTATAVSDDASPTTGTYLSKSSTASRLSTGAIVGAAFAGAFTLLGIVALFWLLLRRKHLYGKLSNISYGERKSVADAESPMSITLKFPPANEEQASMVQVAPSSRGLGPPFAKPPSQARRSKPFPMDNSRTPHNPNASFNHPPVHPHGQTVARSATPPQWGIIPVRLGITHDGETGKQETDNPNSELDLDTPYPSSEIGSSFPVTETDFTSVPLHHERVHTHAES